ncbi:hypothetical protein Tco_1499003 [Tanacetum coccineum]
MPLRDPNIYGCLQILDASSLLSLSDLIFFGDDKDIRTAWDLVSKDKMIWYGEVPQKGRPKLGAPPPPPPPPSQHHHHRCHHQMTHYYNCLIRRQDFGSMILIRVSLSSSGSESAM